MTIIRRDTDYALRILTYMAENPRRIIPLSELSKKQTVPADFLYKICRKLANQEILISARGKTGGYALGRDPINISLRQIVDAVQGPINMCHCMNDKELCVLWQSCGIRGRLRAIQGNLDDLLGIITLAELLKDTSD